MDGGRNGAAFARRARREPRSTTPCAGLARGGPPPRAADAFGARRGVPRAARRRGDHDRDTALPAAARGRAFGPLRVDRLTPRRSARGASNSRRLGALRSSRPPPGPAVRRSLQVPRRESGGADPEPRAEARRDEDLLVARARARRGRASPRPPSDPDLRRRHRVAPEEWIALERETSIGSTESSAFSASSRTGRLSEYPKSDRSRRRVPFEARARGARRDALAGRHAARLPGARGGHLDLHNFRERHWKAALRAAGSSTGAHTTSGTRTRHSRSPQASRSSRSRAGWEPRSR